MNPWQHHAAAALLYCSIGTHTPSALFAFACAAGRGQDVAKGRRRDQGAVKISCARQVRLGGTSSSHPLRAAAMAIWPCCSTVGAERAAHVRL